MVMKTPQDVVSEIPIYEPEDEHCHTTFFDCELQYSGFQSHTIESKAFAAKVSNVKISS